MERTFVVDMERLTMSRGTYAGTADRRSEILDAGTHVFASVGYRAGSLQQIADRAGMSTAGVLHHFESKRAILAAILERRDDVAERRLREGGAKDTMPTGLDLPYAMVDLLQQAADTSRLSGFFARVSAEATSDAHPAHGYIRNRYARVVRMLSDAFAVARIRGELRADVLPESAARQFVAVMDGARLQWLYEPDRVDLTAEIRRFLSSVVAAPE